MIIIEYRDFKLSLKNLSDIQAQLPSFQVPGVLSFNCK